MAVADGTAPTGAGTGAGAGESPEPEVESVVLDLAALPPEDIEALPDSVLGALLRRVYDSCAEGNPFVTGHSESV
ncbi:FxSxx-COOH cyclophane-containing RiPP peptide [Streptomyces sp. GQFP]|uniref:FxSxx-COOH cyclophane-containing RiPP peptide n=1 Tax=Streptomyces sp. GQFP TaxID=2907545 RepID=UPI001F2D7D9F|nr:FxSxx-COOH cyclophane-containing RiPP peptide [Streptomyces sp. GQFP]UIX34834.1 FxSxx-COOH protein [Streptomyces sp. GQFP]